MLDIGTELKANYSTRITHGACLQSILLRNILGRHCLSWLRLSIGFPATSDKDGSGLIIKTYRKQMVIKRAQQEAPSKCISYALIAITGYSASHWLAAPSLATVLHTVASDEAVPPDNTD